MPKIEFYFDFLSPYSYMAWTWVKKQPYDFEFYPVSIASLIAHYETKGPAQIAPKRNYLFKDLLRNSKLNNIPFTTPQSLPFNSLYALRLSLREVSGLKQKEIIDAIFTAGWVRGEELGSDDSLKEILKKENLYSEELFAKMEDRSARASLKKNIEQALSKELFGVPSFVVGEEVFWGNDSIKYLEMYIKREDPLDKEKYQQFLEKFKPR